MAGGARRGPPRRPGRTGRGDGRRRAAARTGRARRASAGHPPGEAVERHRVGGRRRLARRAARRARGVGRGVRLGAGGVVHDHEAVVAPPQEPEHFARIARVLLPHDWLTFHLTGRFVTDRGDASGHRLLVAGRGQWRTDLLGIVDATKDWERCLPEVLGPTEVVRERDGGRSSPPVPATTWRPRSAPGLAPGHVASRSARRAPCSPSPTTPVADPNGSVAGFADATGRFLPLVCTLNATKVPTRSRVSSTSTSPEFDQLALGGAAGRRRARAPAVLRRRAHTQPSRRDRHAQRPAQRRDARADRARGGRGRRVRAARRARRAAGQRGVPAWTHPIVLMGGGSQSHAFQRVLADLSGRPVIVPGGEHVADGRVRAGGGGAPPDAAGGGGEDVGPRQGSRGGDRLRRRRPGGPVRVRGGARPGLRQLTRRSPRRLGSLVAAVAVVALAGTGALGVDLAPAAAAPKPPTLRVP